MQRRFWLIINVLFFSVISVSGQKQTEAIRINETVDVDGIFDESFWERAPATTGFFQYSPYIEDGSARFETKVRFIYDDDAVYVAAMLYDPSPDSILRELSLRDQMNNTSWFSVYFDPYNDAKNASGFGVTAAGVQFDIKSTESNGKDYTWDAVWESAVVIHDEGWSVEMRIPYSELRIPKSGTEKWGLQMQRLIRRYREEVVWNPMDPQEDGFNNQFGEIKGIMDIDPPLRLSLMPYVSGYADYYSGDNSWEYSYKGGMDMKLGIDESFTLDMILIPDFGQVQSDDRIVNLSPYEEYYDEKRSFFMEGTELFDKGDIFYSRRIGSEPVGYLSVRDSLQTGEKIKENPAEPQLINASKVSGKTSSGLGLGVLNAMTDHTSATILDTITGEQRKAETAPFTNYNMLVLDKALSKNSYISFANTNVYRGQDYYSANVSAVDFKLTDTTNTYSISGIGALSQKYNPGNANDYGHRYWLSAGKISGDWTWNLQHLVESDTYDPNDMGFLRSNNDVSYSANLNYNKYDASSWYLSWRNQFSSSYQQQYKPREFVQADFWLQSFVTLHNHLTLSLNSYLKPTKTNDFNEPRQPGRKYVAPDYYEVGFMISPDYRKKFLVDVNGKAGVSPRDNHVSYNIEFGPRARLSDHFSIIHKLELERDKNKIGYATKETTGNQTQIIFGNRNVNNITNTLDASYIFNERSALAFRMRHYWMQVNYDKFYLLSGSGYLSDFQHENNEDFTANIFNIDMSYSWRFAPGSELSVVWKNAIYNQDEEATSGYFDNVKNTLSAPGTNSLSVKVLYYIDYAQVFNRNQS